MSPRRLAPVLLALALGGGHALASFDLESAKALVEEECSRCHHPSRALKKHKDRAGWEKTVARMQRYAGGQITDQEAATIVEYLTRVRGPNP